LSDVLFIVCVFGGFVEGGAWFFVGGFFLCWGFGFLLVFCV